MCVQAGCFTVEYYKQKIDQEKSRDHKFIAFIFARKQVIPNKVYLASQKGYLA